MATGPHLTESSLASSCSSSSKSVSVPGDHGRRHCSTTGDRISLSFDSDDESLASPDTSTRANSRAASSSNIRVSFSSALSPRFSLLQESLNNLMRPHQKSSVSFTPHWRWQQPRLRFDWQHLEENRTHEAHVTTDEVLWVVIITMGVAGMRTEILESHDVDWYVLHFFCFVRIVTSSMKYASRFNDHDLVRGPPACTALPARDARDALPARDARDALAHERRRASRLCLPTLLSRRTGAPGALGSVHRGAAAPHRLPQPPAHRLRRGHVPALLPHRRRARPRRVPATARTRLLLLCRRREFGAPPRIYCSYSVCVRACVCVCVRICICLSV
eukprot:291963-Prymnesium_polylepis.1